MTIQDTLNERQKTHGSFPEQAATAQALKDIMRTAPNWDKLQPYQKEALELNATKIARILHGDASFGDNWHDIAGYSTLVERALIMHETQCPTG